MDIGRIREALRQAEDYNNDQLPDDVSGMDTDDIIAIFPHLKEADLERILRHFRDEVYECNDFCTLEGIYSDARGIPPLRTIVLERIASLLKDSYKLSNLIDAWNEEDFEHGNEAHDLLKKRIQELVRDEDDVQILTNLLEEIKEPEEIEIYFLAEDDAILTQFIANRLAKLLKTRIDQMTDIREILALYDDYDDSDYADRDPERVLDWVFLTRVSQLIEESSEPIALMELYSDLDDDDALNLCILDRVYALIRALPDNKFPPEWFVEMAYNIDDYEAIAPDLIIKSRALLRQAF